MISPSFPHGAQAPHFNRKNRALAPGRGEGDDLERGSYGSQSRDRGAGVFSSASFFLGVGPILIGPTKNKAINMAMKYDEI